MSYDNWKTTEPAYETELHLHCNNKVCKAIFTKEEIVIKVNEDGDEESFCPQCDSTDFGVPGCHYCADPLPQDESGNTNSHYCSKGCYQAAYSDRG